MHSSQRPIFAFCASLLLFWCGNGCNQRPNVPFSDLGQAKTIATKVLDAWKSGKAMEEMKSASPPVFVSEDLWRNHLTLVDYKIDGDGEMMASNVRFKVLLTYTDKGGRKVERSFKYLVTTTPAVTFFREEG
jgi:hypothetical protein